MRFFWVPESSNRPGQYAPAGDSLHMAHIHGGHIVSTRSICLARKFDTKEECQAWCDENPHPAFAPVEHGVEDDSDSS